MPGSTLTLHFTVDELARRDRREPQENDDLRSEVKNVSPGERLTTADCSVLPFDLVL